MYGEWRQRSVVKALALALIWTVLPAAVLGAVGGAVMSGLFAPGDVGAFRDFKIYFYGISTLWFLFALLDGVPARLMSRFRIGQPHVQAVGEGWLCRDRKAFEFGPSWWGAQDDAGGDEFRRRYYCKYGSNRK